MLVVNGVVVDVTGGAVVVVDDDGVDVVDVDDGGVVVTVVDGTVTVVDVLLGGTVDDVDEVTVVVVAYGSGTQQSSYMGGGLLTSVGSHLKPVLQDGSQLVRSTLPHRLSHGPVLSSSCSFK